MLNQQQEQNALPQLPVGNIGAGDPGVSAELALTFRGPAAIAGREIICLREAEPLLPVSVEASNEAAEMSFTKLPIQATEDTDGGLLHTAATLQSGDGAEFETAPETFSSPNGAGGEDQALDTYDVIDSVSMEPEE